MAWLSSIETQAGESVKPIVHRKGEPCPITVDGIGGFHYALCRSGDPPKVFTDEHPRDDGETVTDHAALVTCLDCLKGFS